MRKSVYAISEQQRRRSAFSLRSLISAFVIRCIESIIPLGYYNQAFKSLASFNCWAGLFESYLVTDPEDRFSRDEAQIIF